MKALAVAWALGLAACGSPGDGVDSRPLDGASEVTADGASEVTADGASEVTADGADTAVEDATSNGDAGEDTRSPEVGPEVDASDAGPGRDTADAADIADAADTGPDVPPRRWAHRAIGGMSMGAAAINIALRQPEAFDVVGALGGYVDLRYMVSHGLRLQLAGFCPLETLEAHVDSLDDRDADPPIFCGPAQPKEELEVAQDFNHLHYDTNGATFHREFYMRVFQSLTMAYGNFTSEPSDVSPYLPIGVDFDWFRETPPGQQCDEAPPIPQELSYNAEYNPEGTYPVIPVCDSRNQALPGLGGADFDPTVPHRWPTEILLAVDINENGERDYGEPLFKNARERFDDVGADGCPSPREDGAGGCLAPGEPNAPAGTAPGGGDVRGGVHPLGTEGNSWRDEGEPYRDYGLDGVPGTGDQGEDNGAFDMTSAFERASQFDASRLMTELPDEQVERLDFWFDAGIRDPLHAAVSTRHVVGRLRARDQDVRHYRGFMDRPEALFPDDDFSDLLDVMGAADLSPEAIGRHVYVEYGDPAAPASEIEAGDGKHVGTNEQVMARLLGFLVFAAQRLPDPGTDGPTGGGASEYRHFYSEGLRARRGYTVALPPGYDAEAESETRYPTLYFLHGLGQEAADLAPAVIATSSLMRDGTMPRALVVFPDGACCYVHTPTGRRECACRRGSGGKRICVEPTCEGPEDTCEEREIPSHELVEECNGGSLYFDLLANRWGEPRDDLGYATSVMELVEEVDARFRTRSGSAE